MSSNNTITYKLGNLPHKKVSRNGSMTRSRAIGNIPNKLMADYYRQRLGRIDHHRHFLHLTDSAMQEYQDSFQTNR
jgi:hypothetical protein